MYDLGMSANDRREPVFDFSTQQQAASTPGTAGIAPATDPTHAGPVVESPAQAHPLPTRPVTSHQVQSQPAHPAPQPAVSPAVSYVTTLDGLADDTGSNLSLRTLMLLSGIVVAVTMASAGGFWLTKAGTENEEIASHELRERWASQAALEKAEAPWPAPEGRKVRNIDLTQTGSVSKREQIKDPVRLERNFPTAPKPAKNSGAIDVFHVVQPGDTISAIGRKYKISANALMELNNISDARKLKPGMKLVVSKHTR